MNEGSPVARRTEVCDLLGCDYPIVLAGMGGVARSELALAVTKAGGFGFLGMVRERPALIREEVEAMRRGPPRRSVSTSFLLLRDPNCLRRRWKLALISSFPV